MQFLILQSKKYNYCLLPGILEEEKNKYQMSDTLFDVSCDFCLFNVEWALVWFSSSKIPSLISLVCSTTYSDLKEPEQEDVCANSFVMDLSARTKPYGKWEPLLVKWEKLFMLTKHIHLVHYINKGNRYHRCADYCTFALMFIQYICHNLQPVFSLQGHVELIQ